jgi:hypothetical protein
MLTPTLTQKLDQQTEQYLTEILVRENMTSDELIKALIHDRWLSLQAELPEPPKRKTQKQAIAEYVRKKYARPI